MHTPDHHNFLEDAIDSLLLVEAFSTRSRDTTKCYTRDIQPRRCTLEVGCRSLRACCEWVIVSKKKTTHSAAAVTPTSASQGDLGDEWDGFSFSTSHRPNEKRVGTFRPRSPTISLKDHLLSHANPPRANQLLSNSLEESLGLSSTKPQVKWLQQGE